MATEPRRNSVGGSSRAHLLDIPGLAEYLGNSPRHVRRLIAERRLPYLKIGGLVRFDPEDVDRWLEQQRQPPAPSAKARIRAR